MADVQDVIRAEYIEEILELISALVDSSVPIAFVETELRFFGEDYTVMLELDEDDDSVDVTINDEFLGNAENTEGVLEIVDDFLLNGGN